MFEKYSVLCVEFFFRNIYSRAEISTKHMSVAVISSLSFLMFHFRAVLSIGKIVWSVAALLQRYLTKIFTRKAP